MTIPLLTRPPVGLQGEEPAPETAPAPTPEGAPAATRPTVTLGEVAVLAAVIAIGLVAWAALALANLGQYRLWSALALGLGALAVAVVVALRARPRLRVTVDRAELGVLALLALVASWLFFPGFPYGIADKDPGVYVSHGISIARTGDSELTDPVRERVARVKAYTPGARLPAVWFNQRQDGSYRTYLQFYHLWPAALAVAWSIGELPAGGGAISGIGTLVNLNPAVGVLAILAFALALRRAFGLLTGAVGGLLLALNMLQVWQARYQTAEVFTEALLLAALVGVLIALRTGWRPAAGLAGLLLGLGFLARADTLLIMLLLVGVGAVLITLGRWDARAWWFAGGLALTLPHGMLQAYYLSSHYTLANGVPGWRTVAAATAGALLAALALRQFARPLGERVLGLLRDRRAQVVLGLTITGLAGIGTVFGFLRPILLGADYFDYNGRIIRSYDEQTMIRLSWFFTLPGMALFGAGIALVALRRWRAAAWAVILPVLVSLPVYAVAASNSSRLLWWNRRFVPVVVPGIIALIAIALVAGLLASGRLRWPVRAAAAVSTAFLLVVFAGQSLPLRAHQEFVGSFQISQRLADIPGDRQGVFLFGQFEYARNATSWFGAPLWLQHGEVVGLLPVDDKGQPTSDLPYVRAYQRAFPGQPVYLVVQGPYPPGQLSSLGLLPRDRILTQMPMWEESNTERPDEARLATVDLSVWEVTTPA